MTRGTGARYQVSDLLGRGGMGAVYRAHDNHRGIVVALKRLAIDAETRHREERIALFHREYRTLVELKHPCVIEVYDYGSDEEGPYYTMELLDGADVSSRAPLPWREACSLARDVCSSLALLHSRGSVHRDVSPLNVRCTRDGRAKLIDFGAMVPMGISTLTMGTPPCVAPEALGRQPLDGRVDLFALGATLYFALSGHHAFPARNLTQLSVLHERPPRPLSMFAKDVPEPLDRLVMSLLSVDPMARPRHAAEVMDRLTILADLEPMEQIAVHEAYLSTPALVGREAESKQLGAHLRKTLAGTGSVIKLFAAPGGGRSRMLHATVLDARLAGARALQAGSSDAADGPYGVLRALLAEAQPTSPQAQAMLVRQPELRALLSSDTAPPDTVEAREALFKELTNFALELARAQPLLIAVDDIERCDEPSLAAISTLAARVHRAPVQIVYTDCGAENEQADSALSLLRELSEEVALPALDLAQTEALLGSVFGQVPNLATLSQYVFERATGNPRSTMELTQALVDRKLARYELGSWTLPSAIAADALPASFADVRRAKLDALSDDARELASVLAITDGYALPFAAFPLLTGFESTEQFDQAHAELLRARLVEPRDAQVLADRSWIEIVRQSIDPSHLRSLYRRLAGALETRGDKPSLIARCLMRAGDEARAIDRLCTILIEKTLSEDSDADYPELLQEVERACVQLGRPVRDRFLIQRELIMFADRVVIQNAQKHFLAVLHQLKLDSGLADWLALEGKVPSDQRLAQALTAVQARYDAAKPEDRVLSPFDAIRGLVETTYATSVYAAVIGDAALIDELPPLYPFEPLSPAISAISESLRAQRALIGAKYEEALELYNLRLANFNSGANATNLSEAQLRRSRLLLHYVLGALQAGLSIKGALDHAQTLDDLPDGETLAASVRESYYVRRGNTHGAAQWRRRRELLQIQNKRPHALKLRQASQQLECAAHADDLEETKRNLEVLEELLETYPSIASYVHYGRAEYERIRGDYAAGLRHIRVALGIARAGIHPVWPWAAGSEIECLRHLKRLDEAREIGLQRVAEARAGGLRVMGDHVEVFLALTEADLGMFESAAERLDRGIEYREKYGMYGLNLGWSYEARAQLALMMKDRATFTRCIRSCADHYQNGRENPALAARYQRLVQAGVATWQGLEELGLAGSDLTSVIAASSAIAASTGITLQTIIECSERDERARIVLSQLLKAANCQEGQLYLLREGGLSWVAGDEPTPEMTALVERVLGVEADAESERTLTGDDDADELPSAATQSLTSLRPVLLTCSHGNDVATVGVVTLRTDHPTGATGFFSTARELSRVLIQLGDVKPRVG